MTRTLFVRVASPHFNFAKEIDRPNNTVIAIHVHGFDELGRPVMPVHEVPECEEILSAVYKETIFDVDENGKRIPRMAGRLVIVEPGVVDQLPRWIGHPQIGDTIDTIMDKTRRIRAEQLKGDAIMGEKSLPYLPPVDILMDQRAETLEARTKATEAFEKRLETALTS